MDWNTLLDKTRLAPDSAEPKEWLKYDISDFEKDYKKIVASSAFRRLQDKTQVFPLDKSDFVRTRLTHSLEVSMTSKQLGAMACRYILDNKHKIKNVEHFNGQTQKYIEEVLMCAGLLHDLGNPPFGHFGETVIRDWFRQHFSDKNFKYNNKSVSSVLSSQMRKDLEQFEGNAQSLRLLIKAANDASSSDLNLTNAVIHALMKYPTDSESFDKKHTDIKRHKNGYFKAEYETIKRISESTGTLISDDIARHPLTFLLEAGDDIAYATADLEDAFKKGLFTLEEFVLFYDKELLSLQEEHSKPLYHQAVELIDPLKEAIGTEGRTHETDEKAFNEWVKYARGWLMYCAAYGFTKNYTDIMSGNYTHDLFADTFHELSIEALKEAMVKFAYHSKGIVKLELSAQTIITSLLDKFVPAVFYFDEPKEKGKQSAADCKYTDLISENYKNDYKACKCEGDDANNLYLRLLMVTDYISGMTDSFAKDLYQELNGTL